MSAFLEKLGIIPKIRNAQNQLYNLFDYNYIGLDFGDGEISAYRIVVRIDTGAACGYRIELKPLLFDEVERRRQPTAFYRYRENGEWKYELLPPDSMERARRLGAEVYSNFKRCPGTEQAAERYKFEYNEGDGGEQNDSLTYEDAMAEAFNLVFNALIKENNIIASEKTIILVGCPSSSAWVGREEVYRSVLKSRLQYPAGFSGENVYIAIHRESNAAMAEAMKLLDGREGRILISQGEITVIIDNGSSTMDITVVGMRGTVVSEDSYQFGGNDLDENIITLIKDKLAAIGLKITHTSGQKLGMRLIKERGYDDGWEPEKNNELTYVLNAQDGDGKTFTVTVHVKYAVQNGGAAKSGSEVEMNIGMSDALNNVERRAYHLEEIAGNITPTQVIMTTKEMSMSWLNTCYSIYTDLYNKNKNIFGQNAQGERAPDHLILCGGVSKMPEVKNIAEMVFRCGADTPDEPNFVVSKGLARIIGAEVVKTLLVKDVEDKVRKSMKDNVSALRKQIIDCAEDDEWNIFSDAVRDWSEQAGDASIQDFLLLYEERHNERKCWDNILQQGAENWYERSIEPEVQRYMQEAFNNLFPGYAGAFQYDLNDISVDGLRMGQPEIQNDPEFFFGKLTCKEKVDKIFDSESESKKRSEGWRRNARDMILKMQYKIRKGGEIKVTYKKRTVESRGRLFFKHYETVEKDTDLKMQYGGYRAAYKSALTRAGTDRLIEQIFEDIETQIEKFAESITPYFV